MSWYKKANYINCPKCGKNKAYYQEMHPDTDMNEIILYCPDCGEVDEKEVTIKCPFCNQGDYDLVGLKSHLIHGDCDKFNNIENIKRIL